MYNRYQGNSGRMRRVEEPEAASSAPLTLFRPAPPPPPPKRTGLGALLQNSLGTLETEDLMLLLILYLMYRESGDSELLIIMGAMFLG